MAQNELGRMYQEGRGVPQSDTEAIKWYRKAAEQGLGRSQNNLGWMYKSGRAVSPDMETAYMWFYVGVANGYKDAQEGIDDLEGKGLFNRGKISPQEIDRAKERAKDFLGRQEE